MKKIIFLLCFVFMVLPVFSAENNSIKEEVKRVKLEAKQKVEQIKAEAKAAKIKAKNDAKKAKIDAKNAEINAAKDAKKAKKTAKYNTKAEKIKAKNDAKKAKINGIAKAKKDKIDAIANAKIAKIEEHNVAAIAALKAKYEGKKPEKTVNAQKVADKKPRGKTKKKAEPDNKILPASELKTGTGEKIEKKPAVYFAKANFETKKAEIMDELKLSEKQRTAADKLYEKNKAEIADINAQMETLQNEMKAIKNADLDAKFKERHLLNIEYKMGILYQERDNVHNAAMKKFDNILEDEQKEIWMNIKTKGARLFPDVEAIK